MHYALDYYVKTAPSYQTATSIFKDEWISIFPAQYQVEGGFAPLFEDARAIWAIDKLGGVAGKSVLELGPMEGAHSYLLEKKGNAASILGIEANTKCFLRCLVTKEVTNLQRVRYLCGDFVEFLKQTDQTFDVCFASGVLYHMVNPIMVLGLLKERCKKMYLWTHYFDENILQHSADYRLRFSGSQSASEYGFAHTLYQHNYLQVLDSKLFIGGTLPFSNWLSRQDLLAGLNHVGFQIDAISFDDPIYPNGPALAIVASVRE
ncbi:class I SAM-dependent methyltransferase [Brevibacillus sp. 7WMA2]|uniref:class I SAM-dependent methyltransferase n=1 Tax=Brevibacillus sp. 7WMA2 TaxID=2683193 RepID=UPI0013A71C53|nr:class I SAM-dependent methyltransferase [Brevibacillus sp. 7WMA2]QIC06184.1 class I SAM-dependent methyltransferase [Brevibacillus sp. 7WMA2]